MIPVQPPFQYVNGYASVQRLSCAEERVFSVEYERPKTVPPRKPSEALVENSNTRPDVAKVAVLGYN